MESVDIYGEEKWYSPCHETGVSSNASRAMGEGVVVVRTDLRRERVTGISQYMWQNKHGTHHAMRSGASGITQVELLLFYGSV